MSLLILPIVADPIFLLQGGLQGSMLTYHCGPGKYPFPVGYRLCGPYGEWSPMKLRSGRVALQAVCKGNVLDDAAFSLIRICTQ